MEPGEGGGTAVQGKDERRLIGSQIFLVVVFSLVVSFAWATGYREARCVLAKSAFNLERQANLPALFHPSSSTHLTP